MEAAMAHSLPDRIISIVGAMKTGTDSLYEYVTQHPRICGCEPWEAQFFARDEKWERGPDWYADLWDWDPDRHEWALEKSPTYTKRPRFADASARIVDFAEDHGIEFRFVYSLRNPLERIASQATHEAGSRWGRDDVWSFDGIEGRWLAASMYAKQIEPFVERFGRDRVDLVNFEDLKEDPEGLTRSIWDFLGLDTDHPIEWIDPAKQRTVVTEKIKHPLLRFAEATGFVHVNRILSDATIDRLNDWLRTPVGRRCELTATQEAFYLHALMEDLRQLRDRYGVEIDRWGLDLDDLDS